MCNYLDKASLYAAVEECRRRWNITADDYPLDTKELCRRIGSIVVKEVDFKTPGLRGMAAKRLQWDASDIILLNASRSPEEQNFDCGHELIHLTRHRNAAAQSFHCFEQTTPSQNVFLEWQANEGAAELILPYKVLVKRMVDEMNAAEKMGVNVERTIRFVPEIYSRQYHVTEAFIRNRIRSLAYEICQYAAGTAIDDVKVVSRKKQTDASVDLKQYKIYGALRRI